MSDGSFKMGPPPAYTPTPADYERRIQSESAIQLGFAPNVTPRDAALLRRLGTYIDTAEVAGDDRNLLHPEDAAFLREIGYTVPDDEVE